MTGDASRPLPVLLDLRGRRVVVLGAGGDADRAIDRLLAAGAIVSHLMGDAPVATSGAGAAASLTITDRGYVRGDLVGAHMALCFSDDPEVQSGFAAEARAEGCLIHVDGAPALSTFDLT